MSLGHVVLAGLLVLLDEGSVLPLVVVVGIHERGHEGPLLGRGNGRLDVAGPLTCSEALGQRLESTDLAGNGHLRRGLRHRSGVNHATRDSQ